MNINAVVIATGCPRGEWETLLPILQGGGFQQPDEKLGAWLNASIQADGAGDPFLLCRNPGQGAAPGGAPDAASLPPLLADNRSLWLLDHWAAQLPAARFLLLFSRAESALCQSLLRKEDAGKFLDAWRVASRQLLQFQRRHRQRTVLLDAAMLGRRPVAFADVCRHLDIPPPEQVVDAVSPAAVPVLVRLVAERLISTQPELRALQAELEASALPLDGTDAAPPLQATELIGGLLDYFQQSADFRQQSADFRQLQEQAARLEASYKDATQEGELLLMQVHQMQEELAASLAKCQELERRLEAVNIAPAAERQLVATADRDRAPGNVSRFLARLFGSGDGERKKLLDQARLVEQSGLFDKEKYLADYPDVQLQGLDPIRHYLKFGAAEGRNPSAAFNTRYYLETYPDVAQSGMNPLIHYAKFGRSEGRRATPFRPAA